MDKNIEIIQLLCDVVNKLGREIDLDKISVIDRGKPHKIQKLPENSMAIYMFKYKDEYLKIGKVGSKINPRFTSHHYNPNSAKSSLAKCIINDGELNKDKSLNESNIKEWMKNNLQRIDIILL